MPVPLIFQFSCGGKVRHKHPAMLKCDRCMYSFARHIVELVEIGR
ncbi:hypothetical protein [Microcoleus sp.]